jgi:histone H3/H4
LLEKTLQELNPSLHFTEQAASILKNVAKVFLIELFEEAIEIREKTHKREIDEEILEAAYRKLKR